jgi:type IV secretory pathway VirB2 component (pilin)
MKTHGLLVVLLLLGAALWPAPAHAAGGGTSLPFNDTLTLIQENLTGPTANTIVVMLIVAGLITVGVSKETPMLKHFGQLIIVVALLAKAATLPSALGLGSVTSRAHSFLVPGLAVSTAWFLFTFALCLPLLGERRSPRDRPTGTA